MNYDSKAWSSFPTRTPPSSIGAYMSSNFASPISRSNVMSKGVLCALILLIGLGSFARADEPHRVTGKVFFQQIQIAYIGSGAVGKGTLTFRGRAYPIKVIGLGVGGIGLSKLTAAGDVYDLNNLADFAGLYGQARTGWAIARQGRGQLWLANTKGITLKLRTQRQGFALTGGADGVDIRFAQ
jgi:hypothetical protein